MSTQKTPPSRTARRRRAILSLTIPLALTLFFIGPLGCAVEVKDAPAEGEFSQADEERVDSSEQAYFDANPEVQASGNPYTPFTSEELPQVQCRSGYAAVGADCSGSYCDNYRLACKDFPGSTKGDSEWSPWFEDGGRVEWECPGKTWVTGVACDGSYCDNIKIRCQDLGKTGTQCIKYSPILSCMTSGFLFGTHCSSGHSEENNNPFLIADKDKSGWFMKGIRCRGQHCDDKYYTWCKPE